VALFNGSHGGQPISFFQRNDATPNDLTTNWPVQEVVHY
jgi:hypothetical protein